MASATVASLAGSLTSVVSVQDLSSRTAFSSSRVSCFVKQVQARTVCSVEKPAEESLSQKAGKIAATLALAALVSGAPLVAPEEARADYAGLTACKDSKAFAKRQKNSLKKLENRKKLYAPDSAPALALDATIAKTEKRFSVYAAEGLLCGADGLPHLIVDGNRAHLGEFVYPGIVFLYITGWIGWVGRSYLIAARSEKKPTEKEIIIDVPLASRLMWTGAVWPLKAVSEFKNGQLLADAKDITVSPR